MQKPYNEIILETSTLGIKFAFYTKESGYSPLHWHEEAEIIYPLNGESDILIEGVSYRLKNKQLIVIDSKKIHSTRHYGEHSMFLCIHIAKKALEWYFPKIQDYHIWCCPDTISDEQFEDYLKMNQCLQRVTELYITDSPAFLLESEGLVLQLLSCLLLQFSSDAAPHVSAVDKLAADRIRQIIQYVENHYAESVTLQDAAGILGVSKEYFCRFFKQNMGISFMQYTKQVRVSHIYQDLIHTDLPVAEVMEKNGFTNQKLCNRTFKEQYGCTPSKIRKSTYTREPNDLSTDCRYSQRRSKSFGK